MKIILIILLMLLSSCSNVQASSNVDNSSSNVLSSDITDNLLPYEEILSLKKVLNLDDVKKEDIKKVSLFNTNSGKGYGSFKIKYTSTSEKDIDKLYNFLNSEVVKIENKNFQEPGQNIIQYTYSISNKDITFNLTNNCYQINGNVYKLIDNFAIDELSEPDEIVYSFITYSNKYKIYTNSKLTEEQILIGEYDGLSEFEFVDYQEENLGDYKYILKTDYDFISLNILNETVFEKDGKLYQLINENKFNLPD